MKPARTAVLSVSAVGFVFVVFLALLSRLNFLTFTGSDPSAKVVAAALALVGAFLGSVVAIAGIVLKYSIDARAETRQAIEKQRNDETQRAAERRLEVEAAIRAVQLLATSSGAPSPPIQRAGALLMLANLGQHSLTTGLVAEALPKSEIEPSVAARLLNEAMLRGDEYAQQQAVDVLSDNARMMITPYGYQFPHCVLDATPGRTPYVREWSAISLGMLLAARPPKEWLSPSLFPYLTGILAGLALHWQEESDSRIRDNAGAILAAALDLFPTAEGAVHPRRVLDFAEIRSEISSQFVGSSTVAAVVRLLTETTDP